MQIFEVMDRTRITRKKAKEIAIREQQSQINFQSDSHPTLQTSQLQVGNASHTSSNLNDENLIPSTQINTPSSRKRTRGPTMKRNIYNMPPGQRLKLEFDELNRPFGTNVIGFAHFLGSVARNGDLLPIDVFDWRYMQEQNIKDCLELVRVIYIPSDFLIFMIIYLSKY